MSSNVEQLAQLALETRKTELSPLYREIQQSLLAEIALDGVSMDDLATAEASRRANTMLVHTFLNTLPRALPEDPPHIYVEDAAEARAVQASVVWISERSRYQMLERTAILMSQLKGTEPEEIDESLYIPRPFYVIGKERPIAGYHRFLLADASQEMKLVTMTASRFSGAKIFQEKLKTNLKGGKFSREELESMYVPAVHMLAVGPNNSGSAYYGAAADFQVLNPVEILEDEDMAEFKIHRQLIELATLFGSEDTLKGLFQLAEELKDSRHDTSSQGSQLKLF